MDEISIHYQTPMAKLLKFGKLLRVITNPCYDLKQNHASIMCPGNSIFFQVLLLATGMVYYSNQSDWLPVSWHLQAYLPGM